eukprot:CAMPEP_0115349322 /NCGR_PEP_ID=MMETSP0270-20121206/95862_1 /TAXON_ID=71861 /ORGANISM="Scrippsiella trochoidea, Strain CCMP3099" /LENGTH=65 /DNA_ID=CAMNT_0002771323 /DNA_START=16 /DNA_END=210 /DNA_ORIENTATION=-
MGMPMMRVNQQAAIVRLFSASKPLLRPNACFKSKQSSPKASSRLVDILGSFGGTSSELVSETSSE